MALEEDRYASLAFLAFIKHVDTTTMEHSAVGMAADVEFVVDIEEVLEL